MNLVRYRLVLETFPRAARRLLDYLKVFAPEGSQGICFKGVQRVGSILYAQILFYFGPYLC